MLDEGEAVLPIEWEYFEYGIEEFRRGQNLRLEIEIVEYSDSDPLLYYMSL